MGFEDTGDDGDDGLGFASADVATTKPLPASTYDNGADGVGATLTADANGSLPSIDGVIPDACGFVLVKNQANAVENGLYHVDDAGDGASPWILSRADGHDTTDMGFGAVTVRGGSQKGDWTRPTSDDVDVGTDDIIYEPFNAKPNFGQRTFFAAAASTADVAGTYSNGAEGDGAGARLVGSAVGALGDQDGVTPTVGAVLLLKDQTAPAENGLYTVEAVGDGSNIFELNRHVSAAVSDDLDRVIVVLQGGSTLVGRAYQQTAAAPTIGTTALTFVIFSALVGNAYTETFATIERVHATRTAAASSPATPYTPHATGAVPVTSAAGTDLDTTAAALDTAIAELDALTTKYNALRVDQQDTGAVLNGLLQDLRAARLIT